MKPNLENCQKFQELHSIYHKYGYLFWKYGTDDNVEIHDMMVNIKRRGYGTKLIKALVDALKDNPPEIIFLFTKEHNKAAQSFYEAVGFQKGGQLGDNILYWKYYETFEQ